MGLLGIEHSLGRAVSQIKVYEGHGSAKSGRDQPRLTQGKIQFDVTFLSYMGWSRLLTFGPNAETAVLGFDPNHRPSALVST